MSGEKILRVLHEADSLTDLDVCLESFYNETTENHVLKNLIPPVFKGPVRAPHSVILAMSFAFLALYSLKWVACYAYSKKMESRYSVFFWQLVNFLSWLFFLHPLTVVAYLYEKKDMRGWPELCKHYLFSLYPYTLVLMALFSYNIVFKSFFRTPLSRSKWCMIFAVLCITSSFSTLYGVYIHGWPKSDENLPKNAYHNIGFVFLRNPEQREIIIFLLCNHIIPCCLIIFLVARMIIELMKRNEWDLFNNEKIYSIGFEDRKHILLSFCLSVYYVVTNTLFLLRVTARLLTDSKEIDYFIPDILEMLPITFLPFDCTMMLLYVDGTNSDEFINSGNRDDGPFILLPGAPWG